MQWLAPREAVREAAREALRLSRDANAPVVLADTQDNPGAGGDSNTNSLLHALLPEGAGLRHPRLLAQARATTRTRAQAASIRR